MHFKVVFEISVDVRLSYHILDYSTQRSALADIPEEELRLLGEVADNESCPLTHTYTHTHRQRDIDNRHRHTKRLPPTL